MAQIKAKFQFRKSYLAMMISLGLLPSAHAMQELTDSSLSDTTGEGVALVLDDFKMVFQTPNDASSGSSYARNIVNPGQADTGFIRIIPTGENYNKLGANLYSKVYQSTYDREYLNERGRLYNHVYGEKYEERYTFYVNDPTKKEAIKTVVDRDLTTPYRTKTVENLFNSSLMQSYLTQRKADYKDGVTWPWSIIDDGIDDNTSGTRGNEEKSLAQAIKNTYEMIEILFGEKSTNTTLTSEFINSNFYKNVYLKSEEYKKYGRKNAIKEEVDKLLTDTINARLEDEAATNASQYAKTESDKAHLTVVENAEKTAKSAALTATVGSLRTKADVFIYGLALSKSDDSLSTRYSNQGFNWGTASNPWLFHAGSETVKQFTDTGKEVGYLALEAPLATVAANEADNNIKLGFWTDIFSRSLNSSNTVDYATGAPTSGLDISERFRAQFIANGLSMNGSQVRLFQTLTSPDLAYSQTLGLASLIRLNTNDDPSTLTSDSNNLNSKGIRISSAAKENNLDGDGPTPALNGSAAPIFHDTEGLYLYSPNINLVLGSMYQPFVVGSEGNNIILEVTRIPKISDIYNRIYQRYPDGKGGFLGSEALLGSTCNVYTCGTEIKAQASDSIALYQGRDATHSSIAIGSVERIANTNMLKAKDDNNATGVVFRGATDNSMKNFGSAVIDGVLIQHLKIKTTGL